MRVSDTAKTLPLALIGCFWLSSAGISAGSCRTTGRRQRSNDNTVLTNFKKKLYKKKKEVIAALFERVLDKQPLMDKSLKVHVGTGVTK